MDPTSWSTFNHISQIPSSESSSIGSSSNHLPMANFPALSPPFSRQDTGMAGFHQGAAHLLLHSSGSHNGSTESFMNTTSELLKAGYSPAGLLPYAGVGGANQPNLAHSSLFNSFKQKESEISELREGFGRLHPTSMLPTSQSQNSASRLLQTSSSSANWRLPSPVPSSSMFGVLPHESVGSKNSEKSRSSKSKGPANVTTVTTSSKSGSFVYGTSPSAGTTAKTIVSNDLLSSPTYLPQPQYNSFLNSNEKKEVYDQKNSALDYTNVVSSALQKGGLDPPEKFNSDSQNSKKFDSDQSPMMPNQSPANHHSPMVSSAVISPAEPPVYSPAYDFSVHVQAHPSPQNSSLCNHSSPMSSSNAGSPFVSESPHDLLGSKDYANVNPELPTSHYQNQHPILSPTNCNLSTKENYDLISQRQSAYQNSANIDGIALHELTNISDANANNNPSGHNFSQDFHSQTVSGAPPSEANGNPDPLDSLTNNSNVTNSISSLGTKGVKSFNDEVKKKQTFNRLGKPSGKPAGFFNSYLSFVKKSAPAKGTRKRGRPRKYPIGPSNVGTRAPPPKPPRPAKPPENNFTFSDSDEEQDNSCNISNTVQLALNSLADDNIDKNNAKLGGVKPVSKRKIYENSSETLNSDSTTADVYDFDDFDVGVSNAKPSSFRFSSQRKKNGQSKHITHAATPPKVIATVNNDDGIDRRITMRKCVEKLIQKREQRSAKRKKRHLNSDQSSDDSDDDDWIPVNKVAATPRNESDKSDHSGAEVPPVPQPLNLQLQPKLKKTKVDANIRKKQRINRRESFETNHDEERPYTLKTGDFIINIKDMHKERPCIWRIHGKGLMQKYESFDKDDKVLYRNIETFSACNDDIYTNYIPVNVRFNYSQRGNCVVEYLGPVRTNPNFINQTMLDSSQFQAQKENFEVYLQTLISQALDPNFISEIVKENDEYFLSHMREIDEMAIRRKDRLIKEKNWNDAFLQCVQYYPCVNVITSKSIERGPCQACNSSTSVKLVQFYGQPYDYTTLRRTELSALSYLSGNKEFTTCDVCSELVNLYNRLHHQKYNFYISCHTKVNQVRVASRDMRLESHIILENCLQDTEWINKMFEEIMSLWLECDQTR